MKLDQAIARRWKLSSAVVLIVLVVMAALFLGEKLQRQTGARTSSRIPVTANVVLMLREGMYERAGDGACVGSRYWKGLQPTTRLTLTDARSGLLLADGVLAEGRFALSGKFCYFGVSGLMVNPELPSYVTIQTSRPVPNLPMKVLWSQIVSPGESSGAITLAFRYGVAHDPGGIEVSAGLPAED